MTIPSDPVAPPSAKKKVTKIHPKAMAWWPWNDSSQFFIVLPPNNAEFSPQQGKRLSGNFDSEAEAWEDAASRAELQHTQDVERMSKAVEQLWEITAMITTPDKRWDGIKAVISVLEGSK